MDSLPMLATDALKFVRMFGSTMSQSTPHIYLSALPFTPERSIISKHFLPQFRRTLRIYTGRAIDWPASQNAFQGHTGSVNAVAVSPDGKCIVSGSSDETIRIWDAETGKTVCAPLKGHTDVIS